jgi:ribosomal protein S18 acetylase RimI-like enzyme
MISTLMTPPVALRPAEAADLAFCHRIDRETMRWIADELFGSWDEARQAAHFAGKWRVEEVRIITAATGDSSQRLWRDAGWLQTALREDSIFLKEIYLDPPFQRQGIGTRVIQIVVGEAQRQSKAVTLGVAKINPAQRLYERLGFRITHDDAYKFYMRREADTIPSDS